jgi:hypothetical protein
MDGLVLQGVLIDQAIEVLFQCARDFGRSPGARAVDEPPRTLVRKAVDPFTQGGIGKVQCVRDRLEPLPGDDSADRLGAPACPGFFRLL